eukprot:441979-Amphidinium_carterae.1
MRCCTDIVTMLRCRAWAVSLICVHSYIVCLADTVTSIYTCYSDGGPWPHILNHFVRSLQMSSPDIEVHLVRYNTSSPDRLHKAGVLEADYSDWKDGLSLLKLQQQAVQLAQDRLNSWRVAMLVKVVLMKWLVERHRGETLVFSDADHTFFPGWKRPVLDCLEAKDVCFEFQMKYSDEDMMLSTEHKLMALDMPVDEYWKYGELNTGIIAIRVTELTARLILKWHILVMDHLRRGKKVHDQNAMHIVMLTNRPYRGAAWTQFYGFLNPYSVNRAPWRVHHSNAPTRTRGCLAEHLEKGMLIHHAAGMKGKHCRVGCTERDVARGDCLEKQLMCK